MPANRLPARDLYCLRDAICELFGWPPGSDEWNAFIEAPDPADMLPLFEHLGLESYDPLHAPHRAELETLWDHPGIATFEFHSVRAGHAVFVGHLRSLLYQWPLHPEYAKYGPEIVRVVVDRRQPPRL
jgi:hypothetical protein